MNILAWVVQTSLHLAWLVTRLLPGPVGGHGDPGVEGPGLALAQVHPPLLAGLGGVWDDLLQQARDGVVQADLQHGVGDGAVPNYPV